MSCDRNKTHRIQEYLMSELKTEIYFRWNLIQADSDDNKFVDCAISARVRFIVTNDNHFKELKNIGSKMSGLDLRIRFRSHLKVDKNEVNCQKVNLPKWKRKIC
jgi:predicted nucleic acid-binding protein